MGTSTGTGIGVSGPVTICWYMTLKDQSLSPTDEAFTQLWTDVFAWGKSSGSSGSMQLWQNISLPTSLVLINGWPSAATRDEAFGSVAEKEFGEKLGKFIESRGYKQISLDVSTIPLSAPILSIETFSVAATDSALFERRALSAQSHVAETTKAIAAVGGWDVYAENIKKKVEEKIGAEIGQAAKEQGIPETRTWVSITGWADEETHVESAREMTSGNAALGGGAEQAVERVEATPNVFETVHLKKILG